MHGLKGLLETSFVDWPGRVCAVLFLAGCNFRCPFCHNHELVLAPETLPSLVLAEVQRRLASFRSWLGGICITGGEPTLQPRLPDLLRRLKGEGWPIKLDTNGSRPEVLAALFAEGLVDMVAMDVKAPLEQAKYERCTGTAVDLEAIGRSIDLIRKSGVESQLRMTVIPGFHSPEDVREWSRSLQPAARLTLQNFSPRSTLDPDLARQAPFPPERFAALCRLLG